ncbi:MAG: hypothetical protein C5B48_11395 [Candidatus Rokuibacteriota bacterium]|nr:MAG: hypothetical protein C5B48_11395 [Candidatus Rokubacteria bacterium]
MTANRKPRATAARKNTRRPEAKVRAGSDRGCGLCGKTRALTRTGCCEQWICDDEHNYVLFSYARTSCFRNHRRYTPCGYHFAEGHWGDWRECDRRRREFETQMYVYDGTNEYNFVKLENPPAYDPTLCARCGAVIRLAEDAYVMKGNGDYCARCSRALR